MESALKKTEDYNQETQSDNHPPTDILEERVP